MRFSHEVREWIGTGTLVVCAVAVTAAYLHREVWPDPSRDQASAARHPVHAEFVPQWRSYVEGEKRLGPGSASLTIVEFTDFECPFCRAFYSVEEAFRDRHPSDVALIVVNYPLSIHRFAMPAARAVNCADQQGRFEEFARLVFQEQDSLGLKEWSSYAQAAHVPRVDQFRECIASTAPIPAVERGKQLAQRLAITGTPTVLINGWRLPRAPSADELEASLTAAKQRKTPVPTNLQ